MISIYDYSDYRKFLRDRFAELKSGQTPFSYRTLAAQAGVRSPGFFTQVLQAKTNLSNRLIPVIANAVELKNREAHYFELMVRYNQAVTHEDKKHFFEKLAACKKTKITTVSPDAYAFYDKWYYSAVRAVLHYHPFTGDYKQLAKMIVPSITPAEAKKAISVLNRLGFIVGNGSGGYALAASHLTTGLDTDSMSINNFLLNTLDIAKDAFYRFPKEQRSFSALTASVSSEGFETVKRRIDEFRAELVDLIKKDRGTDRVYQINVQLFPLTTFEEKEKP